MTTRPVKLTRPSLGRVASLGSLYDERTDAFLDFSLFNKSMPDSLVERVDTPKTDYKFDFDNSLRNKFKQFSIEGELKLSLFADLVKMQGSGSYLSHKKDSFKSIQCNVIYSIDTVDEHIDIAKLSADLINKDALRVARHQATHVLVGTRWGGRVVSSFEYKNAEDESETEIKGQLAVIFDNFNSSAKGANKTSEKMSKENMSTHFFGDVLLEDRVPNSHDEVVQIMRQVPTLVKRQNNGKGVALVYTLLALECVEQMVLNESPAIGSLLQTQQQAIIDESFVIDAERVFERLIGAAQQLYDLRTLVGEKRHLFEPKMLDRLHAESDKWRGVEAKLKREVREKLVDVRSGKAAPDSMSLVELHKLADAMEACVEANKWIEAKVKRTRDLHKTHALAMLASDRSLHDLDYNKKHMLFMYSERLKRSDEQLYAKYLDAFVIASKKTSKRAGEYSFLVVDYDAFPGISLLQGEQRIALAVWSRGKLTPVGAANPFRERACLQQLCILDKDKGKVVLWDLDAGKSVRTYGDVPDDVVHVVLVDKERFATGHADATINVWSVQTGKRTSVSPLRHSSERLITLCNSWGSSTLMMHSLADGRLVTFGRQMCQQTIKIWNVNTGKPVHEMPTTESINALEPIDGGGTSELAIGLSDGAITLWNFVNNRRSTICAPMGHRSGVVALHSFGQRKLASSLQNGGVYLWNVDNRECLRTLVGSAGLVTRMLSLMPSADKHRLVCGSLNGTITIWNTDSSECVHTLVGHRYQVMSIERLAASSSSANLIASTALDYTVKIWDLESNECVESLEMPHFCSNKPSRLIH